MDNRNNEISAKAKAKRDYIPFLADDHDPVVYSLKRAISRVRTTHYGDLDLIRKIFNSIESYFFSLQRKFIRFEKSNGRDSKFKLKPKLSKEVLLFSDQIKRIAWKQKRELKIPFKGEDGTEKQKNSSKNAWNAPSSQAFKKRFKKAIDILQNISFSKPRIDHDLRSVIQRNCSDNLPRSPEIPTRKQVIKSDIESLCDFCDISPNIKGDILTIFVKASYLAMRDIGVMPENGERKYTLTDFDTAVNWLAKATNSGWYEFSKKNLPETKERVVGWLEDLFQKPAVGKVMSNFSKPQKASFEVMVNPTKLFYRFQIKEKFRDGICEFLIKIRQVFCVPFTICALTLVFFLQCILRVDAFQHGKYEASYTTGFDRPGVARQVGRVRDLQSGIVSGYSLQMFDISKMDRNIINMFFDAFFANLEQAIFLKDDKQQEVYNSLRLYYKFTPIVYMGVFLLMSKGLASGHVLTNIIDSYVHKTLVYFADMIKNIKELEPVQDVINGQFHWSTLRIPFRSVDAIKPYFIDWHIACGDDSLLNNDGVFKFLFIKTSKYFGLDVEIEFETTNPNDDLYYLGSYWDKNNEPRQTKEYIISRIIFKERWYKKSELLMRGFLSVEDYVVNKILATALRFSNGLEFLRTYLIGYEPVDLWLNSTDGVVLASERYTIEYDTFLPRNKSLWWGSY